MTLRTNNHSLCARFLCTLLPICLLALLALGASLFPASRACAQAVAPDTSAQAEPADPSPIDDNQDLTVMFRKPEWQHFWLSGQMNFISQYHPDFTSPYQGPNSLSPQAQDATSRVLTLYTGWQPTKTTEFLCDIQETGGHGLGEALGVAGYFNLDVVRNPTLSKAPYVARLMWHQIIPLSGKWSPVDRNPYSLFRELPERRLEIRFGKFSMADFFDLNTYGTDTNFQFMNWAVDNNGTYDYAADTRGFTFGVLTELHTRRWTLRFSEGLMPKVANGIHLDADLARAHAENIEWEIHGRVINKRPATLRLLTYVNHANMGVYRDAVNQYLAGETLRPDITNHPLQTTIKYGFGVNLDQPITNWVGVFARWGWNEGQHESYAYTEVDQTWLFGAAGTGAKWHRKYDRFGLAFVSNGINHEHARYLGYGGLGFLLGDGKLHYARENILESFYTLHLWRGIFPSAGLQYAVNPGYNKDRGPVLVPSLRLHIEF